jgi:hypothetical protein
MAGLCVVDRSTGLEAPSDMRPVFAAEAPHVAPPDGGVAELVAGTIALWEVKAVGDFFLEIVICFSTGGFERQLLKNNAERRFWLLNGAQGSCIPPTR